MKRLLLAAAAISCLVMPAVSAAQDRGGGPRGNEGRGAGNRGEAGQVGRGAPNPGRQAGAPPRQAFGGQRQAQGQNRGPNFGQDRGQGRDFSQQPQMRDNRGDNRNDGPQTQRWTSNPDRRFVPPPQANRGFDGRFDRNDRDWRNDDNRFDNRGRAWNRNDPNWWRGRPEFRNYSGARNGFWFFPSYGYIRPQPQYYGYVWRRGDFVPPIYRQYVVVDPFLYGLGWPPPGYQWVYLGNDIVLMHLVTGRIIDMVMGVF